MSLSVSVARVEGALFAAVGMTLVGNLTSKLALCLAGSKNSYILALGMRPILMISKRRKQASSATGTMAIFEF